MSEKIILWRWRARGKLDRKWRELRWSMTEEQAAAWSKAEGRDIEKIDGSAEERVDRRGEIGPGAFVPYSPGKKPPQ